jgi:hypothetical protein
MMPLASVAALSQAAPANACRPKAPAGNRRST